MATLTPNIGLSMPDRKENVLISVLNGNFLKIDDEIKKIQDKTQEATDTTAGILSNNDVRIIASEIAGGKHDGIFGVDLTSITSGNTYIYIDSNGVGTVYEALTTTTNSSGFIVPDTTNFANISNVALYDRSATSTINITKWESGIMEQVFNARAGANDTAIVTPFPEPFVVAPTLLTATHNGGVATNTNVVVGSLSSVNCQAVSGYPTDIGITITVRGWWKK